MGNSLCGDEYCVTLGNHANIDMIKEDDESEDDEGYSQVWTMIYDIYESRCRVILDKSVDYRDRVSSVFLKIIDDIFLENGSLNYTLKGPDQHPSSALFYMFEQVYRSGNWKFAPCPHCAGESQGQSSETMPKNNINNNTLPENMDWLRSTISTHTHN